MSDMADLGTMLYTCPPSSFGLITGKLDGRTVDGDWRLDGDWVELAVRMDRALWYRRRLERKGRLRQLSFIAEIIGNAVRVTM